MKRLLGVLFLSGAALALGADDKKDNAVKEEMKKLEGTWVGVSWESAGEKITGKDAEKLTRVIKDNKMIFYYDGKVTVECTFTIDPTKKLKEMDLTITGPPNVTNPPKVHLCIYELDGDTLKVCDMGKKRPKEFTGEESLFVYKRAKK